MTVPGTATACDATCAALVRSLDGALASFVLLESGEIAGRAPAIASALEEAVRAPLGDLLRGAADEGEAARSRFDELRLSTPDGALFVRRALQVRAAVAVVTRTSANAGLVWAELKAAARAVDALLGGPRA